MSLESSIADLVSASSNLTGTVSGKMAAIDAKVQAKTDELDAWQLAARGEYPFVNLLKNAAMTKQDGNGNYIDLPILWYDADIVSYAVVDKGTASLPPAVLTYVSNGDGGVPHNALRVVFGTVVGSWGVGVRGAGTYSVGFSYYVESGTFNGTAAGQWGVHIAGGRQNWNIDSGLPAGTAGTVIYIGQPFVVPGVVTDVARVLWLADPELSGRLFLT